jgi:hypothetical protein
MTVLGWVWLAVFVGSSVGIYFIRKMKSRAPLFLLVGAMLTSLILLIHDNEQRLNRQEAVWHPKAVPWATVPVKIYWDRSQYKAYNGAIDEAVRTWNERTRCQFFLAIGGDTAGSSEQDAQVRIHPYDGTICGQDTTAAEIAEDPDAPASAWYCAGWVDIQTKRLDDVGLAFRIFLHETGHAIGLDHDQVGAMAKKVSDPQPGDPPEYLLPSAKDVEAIHARYCQ